MSLLYSMVGPLICPLVFNMSPAWGDFDRLKEYWDEAHPNREWTHTHDLDDEFFIKLKSMCERLDCNPIDMLGCWMSESGVHAGAYNKGGDAAGIFQVIGSTRRQIGFHGTAQDYLAMTATQQLEWAERFYTPYVGHLTSPSACYLATFLPALVSHGNEPMFVVCARNGPFEFAYNGNYLAFDPHGKGYITVQDLADRISRVTTGPRWEEIVERVTAV